MRTGDKGTRKGSDTTSRTASDVNAEPETGVAAQAPRQGTPSDAKRPWGIRRADGPSWLEKVEQF